MRTELEGVKRRLFVFAAALAALYLVVPEALVLDDLAGLVDAGFTAANRERAPGAEIIGLVFAFGMGEEASSATWSVVDRSIEMG